MKKKNIIIAVSVFVILVLLGLFVFGVFKKDNKVNIAFYKLSSTEQNLIKKAIVEKYKLDESKKSDSNKPDKNELEIPFSFKTCGNDVSLSEFLKDNPNVSLIVSKPSPDFFESQDLFTVFDAETFKALPSTFQHNIFTEKYSAYPFLLNTYELCLYNKIGEEEKLSRISSVDEWTAFLRKAKSSVDYPLVCIGSNNDDLLYLITSIMNLNAPISQSDEYHEYLKNSEVLEGMPKDLKTALDVLVLWRNEGLIHPEWFNLQKEDVEIFMEFKTTALSFLSLSEHREMKTESFADFSVKSVPSPLKLKRKNLPTKAYFVAELKESVENMTAEDLKIQKQLLDSFTGNDGQAFYAKETGFAPVNSSANTYDAQASDSRYWAASSNMIIPDFTEIVSNLSEEEKAKLIKTIRLYIEVNGAGF